jgi:nodulation protein E
LSIANAEDLRVTIAGQISELPEHEIDRRHAATMGMFARLAVLCAGEALEQAGLDARAMDASRIATVIGTGVFGCDALEDAYRGEFVLHKKRPNIYTVPKVMPVSPAVHVSMVHGLKGPTFGVTSACASGNNAFAAALDLLRCGRADVVVAGGADAPLAFGTLKAWDAMRVLAKTGCRPFSADREGLVLGDGAGVLVLERLDHAEKRGAPILAELAGAGLSGDAGDIVSPTLEGPVLAMKACLADAGLAPEEIDYISAHGTSTIANDRTETAAIREVFGKHADALSVSSTKSMHAHCLGASAALEAVACINAIRDSIVPPTIGYNEPDPECDLDVTPNAARERPIRAAISNAFAFGGANAVIAFRRVE